ncbi:Hypothetical predicted protein [Mytilus galloprovincialis]|uniref:Uncharacterized protein n=2 Tax=Mytilus galloprovincialis TaxID=29158 RepID=A0A8B6DHC3_MYTGA|nr:Hypothetical predicted protein [Mytilus galloprovincialis]
MPTCRTKATEDNSTNYNDVRTVHRKLKPGTLKTYINLEEERNCRIKALKKSKSRVMNKLKQLAVKLEREQTYEPLDTLFLIRKKGSKIIKSYGYGELKSRFMEGLPLTDEVPYGKRRKKPAMPVVQKDAVIELLTPGKDNFSFGVGSGRTLAEQQKSQLENLQIAINSPDVNVQVLHESPSPHQPQQIEPPQQIEQQQTQQIEPQQTQQIEPQQHEHDEQHLAQQRKTARKRLYEESFKQR